MSDKTNRPVHTPPSTGDKRNDSGGAPGPKYTIPCPPPTPKKK